MRDVNMRVDVEFKRWIREMKKDFEDKEGIKLSDREMTLLLTKRRIRL